MLNPKPSKAEAAAGSGTALKRKFAPPTPPSPASVFDGKAIVGLKS
jgi:hypothetical protein